MSHNIVGILDRVGAVNSDENIAEMMKFADDVSRDSKVRELFKYLLDEYGSYNGYTMSIEDTMRAVGISRRSIMIDMISRGVAPKHFRTSDKPRAHYRFYMIDVAEFLAGY